MSLNVLSIHGHHDFLAKFKGFKSSNLHALKGNRGLNSSMLATWRTQSSSRIWGYRPSGLAHSERHRQGHTPQQGHCLEPRGSLMLPRFVKLLWNAMNILKICNISSWKSAVFLSQIPQMAPLIVGVAHVAAWWCLDSDSETIRQVTSDQIPSILLFRCIELEDAQKLFDSLKLHQRHTMTLLFWSTMENKRLEGITPPQGIIPWPMT